MINRPDYSRSSNEDLLEAYERLTNEMANAPSRYIEKNNV